MTDQPVVVWLTYTFLHHNLNINEFYRAFSIKTRAIFVSTCRKVVVWFFKEQENVNKISPSLKNYEMIFYISLAALVGADQIQ